VLLGADMIDDLPMTTDRHRRLHQESDDQIGVMVQRADQDIFHHHLARAVILCQMYHAMGRIEATGEEALQLALVMSTYQVTMGHDGRGNPTRGNDVALGTLATLEKDPPTTGRIEIGRTATGSGIDQTLGTLLGTEGTAGRDPEAQNGGIGIVMIGTMISIVGVSHGRLMSIYHTTAEIWVPTREKRRATTRARTEQEMGTARPPRPSVSATSAVSMDTSRRTVTRRKLRSKPTDPTHPNWNRPTTVTSAEHSSTWRRTVAKANLRLESTVLRRSGTTKTKASGDTHSLSAIHTQHELPR
jgi:hypothetical protein